MKKKSFQSDRTHIIIETINRDSNSKLDLVFENGSEKRERGISILSSHVEFKAGKQNTLNNENENIEKMLRSAVQRIGRMDVVDAGEADRRSPVQFSVWEHRGRGNMSV